MGAIVAETRGGLRRGGPRHGDGPLGRFGRCSPQGLTLLLGQTRACPHFRLLLPSDFNAVCHRRRPTPGQEACASPCHFMRTGRKRNQGDWHSLPYIFNSM